MRRHARSRSAVFVAAIIAWTETAAGAQDDLPALTVHAYNYAAVPAATLRDARNTVIRIYREAGVDLRWIDRPADPAEGSGDTTSACLFSVRIFIREKREAASPSTPAVLGTAFEASDGGGTLWVWYRQVVRMARQYGQPLGQVLALAVAHEVGHLVLPHHGHSSTGIMRALWGGDDIRHAVVGGMRFTAEQAAIMRSKVAAAGESSCVP